LKKYSALANVDESLQTIEGKIIFFLPIRILLIYNHLHKTKSNFETKKVGELS